MVSAKTKALEGKRWEKGGRIFRQKGFEAADDAQVSPSTLWYSKQIVKRKLWKIAQDITDAFDAWWSNFDHRLQLVMLLIPSVKCLQCLGFWISCGGENTMKIGQNTFWFPEGDGMRKALHHLSFLHCRGVRGQKQSKNQIFLFWSMHQLMSTLREYWNIFDQICKLSQKSLPKYPLLDEDKYLHYLIRLV